MAAVDARDHAAFRNAMKRWRAESSARRPSILAIDPGKRSTGWAHCDEDGEIVGGQGTPDFVVDQINARIGVLGAPWAFAREALYSVSFASMVEQHVANEAAAVEGKGKKRRAQISPESIYVLGHAAGYVEGGIRNKLGNPPMRWTPKPSTWRAVLRLNRRATSEATARAETQEAVIAYARHFVGGEPEPDFANAVGILIAFGVVLMDALERPT